MPRLKIRFALIALLVCQVLPADSFAAREYSEEVCSPMLGARRLRLYGSAEENLAVAQNEEGNLDLSVFYMKTADEPPSGDEDVVLRVLREKKSRKNKYRDRCFAGHAGSFIREVKVLKSKRIARDLLHIKKNQVIRMRCTWQQLESLDGCSE